MGHFYDYNHVKAGNMYTKTKEPASERRSPIYRATDSAYSNKVHNANRTKKHRPRRE
jgi:hypothetical protein